MSHPVRYGYRILIMFSLFLGAKEVAAEGGWGGRTPGEILGRPDLRPGALCENLAKIQPGQVISMEGAGIVFYSQLWDPMTPSCEYDVQPIVFVDYSLIPDRSAVERLRDRGKPILVAYRGDLHGPIPLGEDDLKASPMIAFTWRVSSRGYGDGKMRAKLVLQEVLAIDANPPIFPGEIQTWRDSSKWLIQSMAMPKYQSQAWAVGLEGEVVVEVGISEGRVQTTRLVSGDRLLALAALEHLETWKLDPTRTEALKVTYSYHLETRRTGENTEPRIVLNLPNRIEIWAAKNGWR